MARAREWFDDESFWETMFPYMFPERRFAETPGQTDALLAWAGRGPRDVLDLGCGPGRFAVELARRGDRVTGVDITPFLLQKARDAAAGAGVVVEWVRSDMRDFVRPGAFDLALSLFTTFGYFDDQGQDALVLRNVHTSLRKGGVLVLDVIGKECLAKVFQPTTSSVEADGTCLVQRHRIFDDWSRIENEWMVIREGRVRAFRFHHTIYSGKELKGLLESAGFASVALYGGLDGSPYDNLAKRLVAVARKSA